MTDKEILDNSKHIIDIKKEIDSGESTAPDLDDQIRNKFLEDCTNRARFIDASLTIGTVAKEFRNVFGVDAPNYDIKKNCFLAYDKNENGIFELNEGIEIKDDPLHDPESDKPTYFTDCWEAINAARFDCTFPVSNFEDDPKGLPVKKQRFFIDSEADSESSGFHIPICPPGFDKWAGGKVYEYICKNFDLNEVALYKMLRDIPKNTIPKTYSILFNSANKIDFNINDKGIITKNNFFYKIKEAEEDQDITPEQKIQEGFSSGVYTIPKGTCDPHDETPIKWYSVKIPVISIYQNGKYYYTYSFEGTPFEKCLMPIVKYSLVNGAKAFMISELMEKGDEVDLTKNSFNDGYAIFCPNPFQNMPSCGNKFMTSYDYKFSINVLFKRTDKMDAGDAYTRKKRFLGFLWETKEEETVNISYTGVFEPLKVVPDEAKKVLAEFLLNITEDALNYYDMLKDREIVIDIPDYENSIAMMKFLYDTLHSYLSRELTWGDVLTTLKRRVLYDITGKTNPTQEEEDAILNPSTGNSVELSLEGEREFITDWIPKTIIKWPKFLLRWFKSISEPKYEIFKKIRVKSTSITKNFNYNYVKSSDVSSTTYLGPKDGDLTKVIRIFDSNSMITMNQLVNDIMSDNDRTYLRENDLVKYNTIKTSFGTVIGYKYNKIKIDGVWYKIDDTKYEVIFDRSIEERPTYDKIQRATDLNWYMMNHSELFGAAYNTLVSRIDKRTGTLRKTFNILDSANINKQMIEQKKKELKGLFNYMNAFEITGGFGTKEATIQLTAWEGEDLSSIYSNLERMGTVYLLADNTTLVSVDERLVKLAEKTNSKNIKIKKFDKNYIKTTITELIDKVSDIQYEYNQTEDTEVVHGKDSYYIVDSITGEYRHPTEDEITKIEKDDDVESLYERGSATSGPVFKVTLQHNIPNNFKGKNPRIVKVY